MYLEGEIDRSARKLNTYSPRRLAVRILSASTQLTITSYEVGMSADPPGCSIRFCLHARQKRRRMTLWCAGV